MRLESSVIAVREVARGESVGYGGAWVAARASRIAIVAAGYGDGLHGLRAADREGGGILRRGSGGSGSVGRVINGADRRGNREVETGVDTSAVLVELRRVRERIKSG